MHVIWKRPDGFHGATPEDFKVIHLSNQTQMWLHREDKKWYPFRISGGWQESEATQKLNTLVNLLDPENGEWSHCISSIYNDSLADDPNRFFAELITWIGDLRNHLKGDTWEIDIMDQTMNDILKNLETTRESFMEQARIN